MQHIRNNEPREWSEFPADAKAKELVVQFSTEANKSDYTISLRQYDVKLNWRLILNGRDIGSLETDEKDMIIYRRIPRGALRDGQNHLSIKCLDTTPDDIRVGEIKIYPRSLAKMYDASVEVQVLDATNGKPLPSRITIVNNGSLQTVSAGNDKNVAVRPGVIYTATGKAVVSFPSGTYRIYAGHGFEYSIDSTDLVLKPGDRLRKTLRIRKEVPTDGWISTDTHIHTFTHSGHGDATIEERAVTVACEGIDLPILTDHNIHVDLTGAAKTTGVDKYFTPVVGDELTTKFGHFNIFETATTGSVADHNVRDWNDIVGKIHNPDSTKVIILNHARDVHNNFRPFGVERHLSSAGISTDDWAFPANAMEVINSGSEQTDFMNLFNDWFGMLNHGVNLTPVGSSDSHDVNRFIVGQGRTYIKSDDVDPGSIDVKAAVKNLREGKVLVSLGLLTKITLNTEYGPGDLAHYADSLTVNVEVYGPSWINASRVALFANGIKIREAQVESDNVGGLKWKGGWVIPTPKHDIYLVAMAEGAGDLFPYWPIAKPYQPASPDWTARVIGSTGAVWIDADKNKRRDAAHDYAKAILNSAGNDIYKTINLLTDYDAAVAAQVAGLLWKAKFDLNSHQVQEALAHAKPETRKGFEAVIAESKLLKK